MQTIKLIPLILGQYFLGLGIVYIGSCVKNTLEIIFGLLIFALGLIGSLMPLVYTPHNMCAFAERLGNEAFLIYSDECTGYLLLKALPVLLGLFSWAYIIIRLFLIKRKGTTPIRFI